MWSCHTSLPVSKPLCDHCVQARGHFKQRNKHCLVKMPNKIMITFWIFFSFFFFFFKNTFSQRWEFDSETLLDVTWIIYNLFKNTYLVKVKGIIPSPRISKPAPIHNYHPLSHPYQNYAYSLLPIHYPIPSMPPISHFTHFIYTETHIWLS